MATVARSVLIGLDLAWPVAIGVVRAVTTVRARFMILSAIGWFGALAIATTAQPVGRALVAGLVAGTAASVAVWLATRRAVTFTWTQHRTYWHDDSSLPRGEVVSAALVTVIGVAAAIVGAVAN
jgi:hypothetical protein